MFDEDKSEISDNIFEIASSSKYRSYIEDHTVDPWIDTPFEGYVLMNNKHKGTYGEMLTCDLLKRMGFNVSDRLNSDHDAIINNIKTEIKFSLAGTDHETYRIVENQFFMNHIAVQKDWERLVFLGINPNMQYKLLWFTKDDFKYLMESTNLFNVQQGGKDSGNDDYMCSGDKLIKLINLPVVKTMEKWNTNLD